MSAQVNTLYDDALYDIAVYDVPEGHVVAAASTQAGIAAVVQVATAVAMAAQATTTAQGGRTMLAQTVAAVTGAVAGSGARTVAPGLAAAGVTQTLAAGARTAAGTVTATASGQTVTQAGRTRPGAWQALATAAATGAAIAERIATLDLAGATAVTTVPVRTRGVTLDAAGLSQSTTAAVRTLAGRSLVIGQTTVVIGSEATVPAAWQAQATSDVSVRDAITRPGAWQATATTASTVRIDGLKPVRWTPVANSATSIQPVYAFAGQAAVSARADAIFRAGIVLPTGWQSIATTAAFLQGRAVRGGGWSAATHAQLATAGVAMLAGRAEASGLADAGIGSAVAYVTGATAFSQSQPIIAGRLLTIGEITSAGDGLAIIVDFLIKQRRLTVLLDSFVVDQRLRNLLTDANIFGETEMSVLADVLIALQTGDILTVPYVLRDLAARMHSAGTTDAVPVVIQLLTGAARNLGLDTTVVAWPAIDGMVRASEVIAGRSRVWA